MTKIIETPTLTTDHLVLRPRVAEDSPILQKYFNNWNIIKCLNPNVPWPYPDNGTDEHFINVVLPNITAGAVMMWCICERKTPKHPIGLIEYNITNTTNREDRGFWIAENYWNKGYMTEAVNIANDFVFFDLGKEKMKLNNYKDNFASRRIKEKTGAILTNTKIETWRGKEREIEIWELTAENWKKFRQGNL